MQKLLTISVLALLPALSAFGDDYKSDPVKEKEATLDEVVVNSTPLSQSLFESAQSVTVLEGESLQFNLNSTLGETISNQPGITSSYFGPGSSRPVIRGLGGDRIRILENGTGSQDVSNTSPDHATSIDPALAKKIEVIRGPAALLYGTNAIGGIVNVFDGRVPEELSPSPFSGSLEFRGGSVDNEKTGVVDLNAPIGPFAFRLSSIKRDTSDIEIPGYARTSSLREGSDLEFPEPYKKLRFSDTNTASTTFGSSYIFEKGFFGAAISNYDSEYGVPNGENDISIDLNRKRLDIGGKLLDISDIVKSMEIKFGVVDYSHTEFEGKEKGTEFKNNGFDARYEITHNKINDLSEGVLGFQLQNSDFEAIGEEAFQPPTKNNTSSAFLFEEFQISDPLKFQLGGRFDYTDIKATKYKDPTDDSISNRGREIPTFGQSVGLVWSPIEDYATTFSIAHTERAPSGQELFANGPHIATAAFEIGDPTLDVERSIGVDLSVKKLNGSFQGMAGVFYNYFDNYIGLNPTGEAKDNLNIFKFQEQKAEFIGAEAEFKYFFVQNNSKEFSIDFQPDYTRARDRDTGEPLPRIPALRMKWGINYFDESLFNSRIELQKVFSQNRNAIFETETSGYTFLNASIGKDITFGDQLINLFLKGNNLTNEEAREHVSFIKDLAPLPGRNVMAGFKFVF